ncbi:MAG: aminoglycoside phosphotransferase family protein [Alphaproteobacteria bacterium]
MNETGSNKIQPQNTAGKRSQQIQEFLDTCPECSSPEMMPLAGDASFRRYIRLRQGARTYMLMDAPPQKEDIRKYLVIAEYLHKHGYSTPNVLASSITNGFLLLEDLGDDLFSAVIRNEAASQQAQKELELYESAIDLLVEWYLRKSTLVNPVQLQLREYDSRVLMDEVGLFGEWFLPQIMEQGKAATLAEEFSAVWKGILSKSRLHFDCMVHRDYHADNLIWLPERSGIKRVGLLDFQDAVYGDPAYDMVSLLEDARRDVSPNVVQHCLMGFLYGTKVNKDRFMTAYAILGAQRNCKIIGIFTRLAVRDKKHQYLSMLPRVWNHLQHDMKVAELAPLAQWMGQHVSQEFRGVLQVKGANGGNT